MVDQLKKTGWRRIIGLLIVLELIFTFVHILLPRWKPSVAALPAQPASPPAAVVPPSSKSSTPLLALSVSQPSDLGTGLSFAPSTPPLSTAPAPAAEKPPLPFRLPQLYDFDVQDDSSTFRQIRGVAISGDGKVLTLAKLIAVPEVGVVDDASHAACPGWLARDGDWVIVKMRPDHAFFPVRIVAAESLLLAADEALILPAPSAKAPGKADPVKVSSGPGGEPFDPAAADFWVTAPALPPPLGAPVLDLNGCLAGLVEEISPDGRLLHVHKVAGPLAVLDEAVRQIDPIGWKGSPHADKLPFADPAISEETVEGIRHSLSGDDLVKACDTLLKEHESSALAWYLAALGYQRAGKGDYAAASVRTLTQLEPKRWESWYAYGEVLEAQNQFRPALDAYQAAVNGANPSSFYIHSAEPKAPTQNSGEAGKDIPVSTDPSDKGMFGALFPSPGSESERKGKGAGHGEGHGDVDLGLARRRTGLALALCLYRTGEKAAAFDQLEGLLGQEPEDYEAWMTLAALRIREGSPNEAIKAYFTALQLDPQSADVWTALGALYDQLGAWKDSCETYRQLILLLPGNKNVWYNLGLASLHAGDASHAQQAFQKVTAIDAGDYDAWMHLARIDADGNRLEDAAADCQKAIGIDSGNVAAWRALILLQYKLGGAPAATSSLAALEKLAPSDAAALQAQLH